MTDDELGRVLAEMGVLRIQLQAQAQQLMTVTVALDALGSANYTYYLETLRIISRALDSLREVAND